MSRLITMVDGGGPQSHALKRVEQLEAFWEQLKQGSSAPEHVHATSLFDAATEPTRRSRTPLTPHQIDAIHTARDSGESVLSIARRFDVHRMTVSGVAVHVVDMSQTLRIVPLSPTAVIPARAHDGDARFDLVSDVDITIRPGAWALVGTGIAIALPTGTVGLVCPRSGLAARRGVTVLNAPGIIDENYRGEVKVILVNQSIDTFRVRPGERIAQLVITSYFSLPIEIVDQLDETSRGEGCFGSTGYAAAAAA